MKRVTFAISILLMFSIVEIRNEYFLPSEMDICDKTTVRTYRKKFCPGSKLVFTGNSTKLNSDCICVSGIWLIINRDCSPSILTSRKGGCIKSPQIKAMQYLGALGSADDFFAITTSSKRAFEYKLVRPVKTEFVQGQVWIYNGNLSKTEKNSDIYCVSKRSRGLKRKVMGKYTLHGRLSIQYDCSNNYNVPILPQLEYSIVDKGASECTLNCSKPSGSKLVKRNRTETKARTVFFPKSPRLLLKNRTFLKEKQSVLDNNNLVKTNSNNVTVKQDDFKTKQLKILLRSYRDHLARTVLSRGFDNGAKRETNRTEGNITMELKHPKMSFKILEKCKEIVYKACSGVVPEQYLSLAYIMFQSIYEVRGTHLLETLQEEEGLKILEFLSDCHSSVQPVKMVTGCNEPVSHTKTSYGYDPKRHMTLEIPWKMIDLTVGICISEFGPSYILYHKMEQALEKLFTKELRTLWKRPPERELFYTRLYGPQWKHNFEKFETCVGSVYARNPKLSRLRRPVEISARQDIESSPVFTNSEKPRNNKRVHPHQRHIEIPQLIPLKFEADDRKMGKMIIPSVNLACQPFDLSECQDQSPYSW